jgi:DNA-binding NarL/FixJ family response regulator
MTAPPRPQTGARELVLVQPDPIRVMIADAQPVERAGFTAMLENVPDIVVAGAATAADDAVSLARELRPDVALVDLDLPGARGLDTTRRLAEFNGVSVVALAGDESDEHLFSALRAGARGFLLKSTEPDALARAVRAVAGGEALLSPSATRGLIEAFVAQPHAHQTSSEQLAELTLREREVLALVALGLRNDEIAAHFVISPATVKTHVSRTLRKLDARDRSQLVVIAYQLGLALPGPQRPAAPAQRPRLVAPS